MKEEIITNILNAMYDRIGEEECRHLKSVLYMTLQNYTIVENSTDLRNAVGEVSKTKILDTT